MDRTAYKNQFNADHYERINFSVPKGMKDIIKTLAADKGMSVNAIPSRPGQERPGRNV